MSSLSLSVKSIKEMMNNNS
jgi:hypothetical protein